MSLMRWRSTLLPSEQRTTIAGAGRFTEVKRASGILLVVIGAVVALLLVWAAFAEVDTMTRADGKVVPSARLQVVQSLEGGIVGAIHVRQAQTVAQDDLLVSLSSMQFGSDLKARRKQLYAFMTRVARLSALAEGREPQYPDEVRRNGAEFVANEQAAFLGKRAEHEAQIAVLDAQVAQKKKELRESVVTVETARKTLSFAREEREIVARMVAAGLEPKLELVRIDRLISDVEGKAETAAIGIGRIEDAISETESRRLAISKQFRAEAYAELNKTLSDLRTLEESMPALQDKVTRAELRAPVAGVVNRLLVTTLGGVVKPGDPIIEIVPADDQLVVEALINPKDIAFIKIGQPAKVKITAYDYSIYGAMDAKVASIGADAIPNAKGEAFYQVRVETSTTALESLGRKLPIIPGMQCQVDIVTGSNTILNYLAKPLMGVKENAFRER